METNSEDLPYALGLGARESVAIVGGGGKTSLMFTLAAEFLLRGEKIVSTTTTKVWKWQADQSPCTVFYNNNPEYLKNLKQGLEKHGHVFFGGQTLESGKTDGIPSSILDNVSREPWVDRVIIEADGSAGRPLKVPSDREPVIPLSTSVVVAMIGLDALGKPLSPDVAFRIERFEKVT